MIFRAIVNEGRKQSAYGLFTSYPELFTGILEDPSGNGRQFLVSRSGMADWLDEHDSRLKAQAFFRRWKRALGVREQSPAIRCLFYAAYEAVDLIESLPDSKTAVPGPKLWAFYPTFSICFDDQKIHVAASDQDALQCVLNMLEKGVKQPVIPSLEINAAHAAVTDSERYKTAVEAVKRYIAAGDIFQANIARFWSMPLDHRALAALYDQLRVVNSAPFSSFVRIGPDDQQLILISSSPERLFRLTADGEVDTRPIAGTRRRGEGEQDESLKAELLLSEKERAEHIMLVDLERNDLGRVCQPGSVEVNEQMVIEQYATVQHIVSNVRGRLADGMDVVDLCRAMFPGGTITGCPKVRCMEIIHELEEGARGPYTGGLGYVAWDGSADMNILIRTFWHHAGKLHWAAGAGIVADSDPQHELIETEHKAEGLLRAMTPVDHLSNK